MGEGLLLEPVLLSGNRRKPEGEEAGGRGGEVSPSDLGLPLLLCHSLPLVVLREWSLFSSSVHSSTLGDESNKLYCVLLSRMMPKSIKQIHGECYPNKRQENAGLPLQIA